MTLHLHLGAHKTASTHLQATLKKYRETFAAQGVVYHPPETIRALIGRGRRASVKMGALPSLRRAAAARRLLRLDQGAMRLVASDENSLGHCPEIFRTDQIYPHAYRRLLVWRRLTRRRQTTVCLAIRDYGAFLSGAYAQSIRNAPYFLPGEAERASLARLPRRWPDVVSDIRRALPRARLMVWRFEDYTQVRDQVMARMTGAALPPVQRRPMATPSAAAMAAIAQTAEDAGQVDKTALQEAMHRFPISAESPRFSLWTPEDAARMTRIYEDDAAALASDLGEDFLRP